MKEKMDSLYSHKNETEDRGEHLNQRILRRKVVNSNNLANPKTSKLINNTELKLQNKQQTKNTATMLLKDASSTPKKMNLRNNFCSVEKLQKFDLQTPPPSDIVLRSSLSDGAKSRQKNRRIRRKLNKSDSIPNKTTDQNESLRLALTTNFVVSVCRTNHPIKNLNERSPRGEKVNGKKSTFLSPIEKLLIKNGSKSIFDTPIKIICNNIENSETLEDLNKSTDNINETNLEKLRGTRKKFSEKIEQSNKTSEKQAITNEPKSNDEIPEKNISKFNEIRKKSREKIEQSNETDENSITESLNKSTNEVSEKNIVKSSNINKKSSEEIEKCNETDKGPTIAESLNKSTDKIMKKNSTKSIETRKKSESLNQLPDEISETNKTKSSTTRKKSSEKIKKSNETDEMSLITESPNKSTDEITKKSIANSIEIRKKSSEKTEQFSESNEKQTMTKSLNNFPDEISETKSNETAEISSEKIEKSTMIESLNNSKDQITESNIEKLSEKIEKFSENNEKPLNDPLNKSTDEKRIEKSHKTIDKVDANTVLGECGDLENRICNKKDTENICKKDSFKSDKKLPTEQPISTANKDLTSNEQSSTNEITEKWSLTNDSDNFVKGHESKTSTIKAEEIMKKSEKSEKYKVNKSLELKIKSKTKSDKKKLQKLQKIKVLKHKIKIERRSTESNEGNNLYNEPNIYTTQTTTDHFDLLGKSLKKELSASATDIGTSNEINQSDGIVHHFKSPSVISEDSAKGSSVSEIEMNTYSIGDLLWAQFANYCYWPCMVTPDPDKADRFEIKAMVNVRFFADNGRRSWIKKTRILVYKGIKDFQQKSEEVKKAGKSHINYRHYFPKHNHADKWLQAVREADLVSEISQSERIDKINTLFDNEMELSKKDRKRRMSLNANLPATSTSNSKLKSSTGAGLVINMLKRERSNSPMSPAYSPVRRAAKRLRKISIDNQDSLANATKIVSVDEVFKNFENFLLFVKQGILGNDNNFIEIENSLYVASRNIWSLKDIKEELQKKENNQSTTNMDELKIVNNNIKNQTNQINDDNVSSLCFDSTPNKISETSVVNEDKLIKEKRPKKPLNRPIDEVIDDIYDLDSKYLFKGLMRDPICKYCLQTGGRILKCSKNCGCWFHFQCNGKISMDGHDKIKKKRGRSKQNFNSKKNNDNNNNDNIIIESNADEPTCSKYVINDSPINENDLQMDFHITAEMSESKIEVAICEECKLNENTKCFKCHQNDDKLGELIICKMPQCKRQFHQSCCRYWPQSKITISNKCIETFQCPSHACHTCVSDDPKNKFHNLSPAKLARCIKCPASYHIDSRCIPAGSQVLSTTAIICPRHFINKSESSINVSWCFICVGGGQLVCCETCPIAVHEGCVKIEINTSEAYICEECESGRLPLYGEMVWAKFNTYRWWPAIILPPTEVPKNIMKKQHNPSEFVVRFFGTHDHGWISRRRVYLYMEGDYTEPPKSRNSLDQNYIRGVQEAKQIYEIIKAKKHEQNVERNIQDTLHPQPYVRIKTNRPVPPVKLHTDLEKVNKCECDPNSENPCGFDSNCWNRVLYNECNPTICPAGTLCQNQMFESRKSPRLKVIFFNQRGFGLICLEPIKTGSFIIEYVGEIINEIEFKQRLSQKSKNCDENYYFLSVEKDYIIDAGPKGNLARFMNHSCDPNCETQKWTVNGLNRVGLFAIKDIPEATELTFNYHWDELLGNERKTCFCGSSKCIGEISGKIKEPLDAKKVMKPMKTTQKNSKRKSNNATKVETDLTKKRRSLNAKKNC